MIIFDLNAKHIHIQNIIDFELFGIIGAVAVAIIVVVLYRMGFRGHGGD